MKPFEYYCRPQTPYPRKFDYITFHVYENGKVLWSGHSSCKTKFELKTQYPNAVIQEVFNEIEYKEKSLQYTNEKTKLHFEFKKDLFEEFGVSDNPKREKAFDYVWDKVPSSYSEFYDAFSDIVDLIRD